MRLRTEPQLTQIRLRTPRVPSVPFTNSSFSKALTKEIFLFDQSFFISKEPKKSVILFDHSFLFSKAFKKRVFLLDQSFFILVLPLKQFLFKFVFSQYYICFPTSVF